MPSAVRAQALEPDGKLLVGGWFKSIDGRNTWGLTRLFTFEGAGTSSLSLSRQADTWQLWLDGQQQRQYVIEVSSDLKTWMTSTTVTMTAAGVQIPWAPSSGHHFCRARLVQ